MEQDTGRTDVDMIVSPVCVAKMCVFYDTSGLFPAVFVATEPDSQNIMFSWTQPDHQQSDVPMWK